MVEVLGCLNELGRACLTLSQGTGFQVDVQDPSSADFLAPIQLAAT